MATLEEYAAGRPNALARTIAAATPTPSPKPQTKAQNESARRDAQLGSNMRRGRVNPISVLGLQQKAAAEYKQPNAQEIEKAGGGLNGYFAAFRRLNKS